MGQTPQRSCEVKGMEPETLSALRADTKKGLWLPRACDPSPSAVPTEALGVAICLYNPLKPPFGTPLYEENTGPAPKP